MGRSVSRSAPLSYFAVIRERSAPWDWTCPMEEQELWPEHARFMNDLVREGLIVLGGPLGDGKRVLLVFDTGSAEELHSRLAADPWTENGMLRTVSVEPWTIRLDAR